MRRPSANCSDTPGPIGIKKAERRKHQAIRDREVMNRAIVGPFPLIYADPRRASRSTARRGSIARQTSTRDPVRRRDHQFSNRRQERARDRRAGRGVVPLVHLVEHPPGAWRDGGLGFEFKTSAVDQDRSGLGWSFAPARGAALRTARRHARLQFQPSSSSHIRSASTAPSRRKFARRSSACIRTSTRDTRLELPRRGDIPGWTANGYEANRARPRDDRDACQCRGRFAYERGDYPQSLAVSSHGIEKNPKALAAARWPSAFRHRARSACSARA